MAGPNDTVRLEVNGQEFTGWTDVKISRGIETFPSAFALRLTERLPDKPSLFPIDPGTRCKVMIGDDLVLTGYVDAYSAQISARGHEVTVFVRSSRSRTQVARLGRQDYLARPSPFPARARPLQAVRNFSHGTGRRGRAACVGR